MIHGKTLIEQAEEKQKKLKRPEWPDPPKPPPNRVINEGVGTGLMMTFIFVVSLILATFLISAIQAHALESTGNFSGYDYHTHYGTTGDLVKFAWDGTGTNDFFEVEFYNPERGWTFVVGSVTVERVDFYLPKTGHWIGRVRGCVREGTEEPAVYTCSTWSESTNAANAVVKIDGIYVHKSWWIFVWIASTGEIELPVQSGGP